MVYFIAVRGAGFRCLIVIATLLLSAPAFAAISRATKACRKTCRPASATCKNDAKAQLAARRTACDRETGAAARACRKSAKATFGAARRVCKRFGQRCRSCCSSARTTCAVPPELPEFSGTFPLPDRRALDAIDLPPAPDGRGRLVLTLPDGLLLFDPGARGPLSAAAECAAAVLACYAPAQRNWAGCLEAVPRCADDTPWIGDAPMCCPSACAERFQELRQEGRPSPAAFAGAIFEAPSCMPGLGGVAP